MKTIAQPRREKHAITQEGLGLTLFPLTLLNCETLLFVVVVVVVWVLFFFLFYYTICCSHDIVFFDVRFSQSEFEMYGIMKFTPSHAEYLSKSY